MDAQKALEQLSDLYSARDLLELDRAALIDKATPPEVKAAIADIEAEFSDQRDTVNATIATLEAEVKAAVVAGGATVKGANLQAVYSKGRTSWDNKVLEGMAAIIPQIAEARKVGEPSVSIRKV